MSRIIVRSETFQTTLVYEALQSKSTELWPSQFLFIFSRNMLKNVLKNTVHEVLDIWNFFSINITQNNTKNWKWHY